jgi:H+/Cl- antiporter ClcA
VAGAAAAAAAAAAAYDSDAGSSLFVAQELPICFHCTLCVIHSVMLKTLQGSLMVHRDAELVTVVDQDVTPRHLWFSGRWSW